MDEDEVLTLPQIAAEYGLNPSTPRSWVASGRLPAQKDEADRRRWLVKRRDVETFIENASRSDVGRPRGLAVEATTRDDWSDAPEQATLDLTSSFELPGARR